MRGLARDNSRLPTRTPGPGRNAVGILTVPVSGGLEKYELLKPGVWFLHWCFQRELSLQRRRLPVLVVTCSALTPIYGRFLAREWGDTPHEAQWLHSFFTTFDVRVHIRYSTRRIPFRRRALGRRSGNSADMGIPGVQICSDLSRPRAPGDHIYIRYGLSLRF
jgi:hypothetical protein